MLVAENEEYVECLWNLLVSVCQSKFIQTTSHSVSGRIYHALPHLGSTKIIRTPTYVFVELRSHEVPESNLDAIL